MVDATVGLVYTTLLECGRGGISDGQELLEAVVATLEGLKASRSGPQVLSAKA